MRNFFVRDKAFYRSFLALSGTLMLEQAVVLCVNLADNVMIGSYSEISLSGVAAVNQIQFFVQQIAFAVSNALIVLAGQYWGQKRTEPIRRLTAIGVRLELIFSLVMFALTSIAPWQCVALFVKDEAMIAEGVRYLDILRFSYPFFAVTTVLLGAMRSVENVQLALRVSVVSLVVNCSINYLLIGGNLGAPELGVRGAAIATTASRFIELAVIVLYTHRKSDSFQFIRGAYRSMHIPARLVRDIAVTGSPLMVNEVLWSLAMTVVTGCYAARGMNAVAAANITTTVWNLFCIIMFAMGAAISIIVGRELGCGNRERAIDLDRKLLFADFVIHVVMGALLIAFSGLIPELYNTEPEVRATAARMLMFGGLALPFESLVHASYFTIRSGGKTWTTFAFDCGFSWVVTVPVAFALCTFTALPVEYIYLAVRTADILKLCIAFYLLKKGSWANTIISSAE